jgi:hypothetical protein
MPRGIAARLIAGNASLIPAYFLQNPLALTDFLGVLVPWWQ